MENQEETPRIRGWLILPAISLVAALVASLIGATYFLSFWDSFVLPQAHFFDAVQEIVFALAYGIETVLFFNMKRAAPFVLIFLNFASLAWGIIVVVFETGLQTFGPARPVSYFVIVLGLLWTGIWIAYFLLSRRVRATFVR